MPAHIAPNPQLKQIHRNLGLHFAGAASQVEKLASGNRVNRSSDNPAGMALANSLDAETRVLAEGNRNIQQTIQLLQVAEGTLSEISRLVARLGELATQSASTTYSDNHRSSIDAEFQSLKQEIDRLAQATTYNGVPLLSETAVLAVQVGPLSTSSDYATIELGDLRASGTLLHIGPLTIDAQASARQSMDRLQTAQAAVLAERNRIAVFQNRLQVSATTAAGVVERLQKSTSDIRDTDLAQSITALTRSQLMSQTATGLALQAGGDLERVLSLLGR